MSTPTRLPTAPDGGAYAHHCRDATCSAAYRWTLTREGDVVTTWACDRHLAAALAELIEDRGPDTRVVVTAAYAVDCPVTAPTGPDRTGGEADHRCTRWCAQHAAIGGPLDDAVAEDRAGVVARLEHEARDWISLADLIAQYRPGSHGDGWTWDDETRDILAADCYCTSAPEGYTGVVVIGDPCGIPGHYQLRLEDRLRAAGRIEQPICLGDDGRVWDGHHRVVAAIRLGIDRLPVEDNR